MLVLFVFLSNCYAAINDNVKSSSTLKWHACKANHKFLCGSISVPLDYAHPQLGNIKLPVSMHPALQKSRGYLLFNFGGPWANNVKILPSITKHRLTPTMVNQFDLLVMNPRGVNPNLIQCHTQNTVRLKEIDEKMKKIFAQGNVHDTAMLYDLAQEKQRLCHYNKLTQYASTANTVEDIESIRKALNIEKLNFYMASYGTRLGLAYLVKYPQHVQRIILDGNIAPSNQLMSLIAARASGAVTTLNSFFNYCFKADDKCVLNNLISDKQEKDSSRLINQFNRLLITAKQNHGIPTTSQYANRPITSEMITNLMYTEMQPSTWKNLANALYEAEANNSGDALMKIYMTNIGYDPKTNSYSTDNTATQAAVICEDYVIPEFNKKTIWLKFINDINSKYSKIGTISTLWLMPLCINWPVKSTPLLPNSPEAPAINSATTPQVLIIGNSKDPMTPFENAIAVSKYLNKFNIQSTIIQWNGVSHTALITDSPLSACVFRHVDRFLLNKTQTNFIECDDWQNPFVRKHN